MKVTIYTGGGTTPGIRKTEGVLTKVHNPGGVEFIPKRGRKARMIMTYYDPFIMVVEGWNKPDPEGAFDLLESGPDVEVSKARYRSTDPRWITDFMDAVGKTLRPIVLFEHGKLVKDTSGLLEARTGSLRGRLIRLASVMPKGVERRQLLTLLASDD